MSLKASYIAGVFDGEGCIYYSNKTRSLKLSIGQSDPAILFRIKQMYGGFVVGCEPNAAAGQKKYVWTWYLNRQADILKFIDAIEPYLIVKRNEALYTLNYLDNQLDSDGFYHLLQEEKRRSVKPTDLSASDKSQVKAIYGRKKNSASESDSSP
jgi:hypothetical protein